MYYRNWVDTREEEQKAVPAREDFKSHYGVDSSDIYNKEILPN